MSTLQKNDHKIPRVHYTSMYHSYLAFYPSGNKNDNELEENRPLPSSVTAQNDSLYPETEELLRIAEQVHAARTRVTGTAENVLQSADQVR